MLFSCWFIFRGIIGSGIADPSVAMLKVWIPFSDSSFKFLKCVFKKD